MSTPTDTRLDYARRMAALWRQFFRIMCHEFRGDWVPGQFEEERAKLRSG